MNNLKEKIVNSILVFFIGTTFSYMVVDTVKREKRRLLREKVHEIVEEKYNGRCSIYFDNKTIYVDTHPNTDFETKHLTVKVQGEEGNFYFYDWGKHPIFLHPHESRIGKLNIYSPEDMKSPEKKFDDYLRIIRDKLKK